jgi:AcrR family transcriptional regulator
MADSKPPASQRLLSPNERRARNREEVIRGILDTACAVIREDGVAALNMHEVARRLGMRAQSLYSYFPSKTALYQALFVMGMRMYNQRTAQVIAQYGTSWDLIQAALTTFMEFAHDYPELYQLIFQRPVPGFVPSHEGIAEMIKLVGASQHVITSLIEAGVIQPGLSAEQTNNLFVALMHGITSLYMANEPDLSPGQGRFGSLIPAAVGLLQSSWATDTVPPRPIAKANRSSSHGKSR